MTCPKYIVHLIYAMTIFLISCLFVGYLFWNDVQHQALYLNKKKELQICRKQAVHEYENSMAKICTNWESTGCVAFLAAFPNLADPIVNRFQKDQDLCLALYKEPGV